MRRHAHAERVQEEYRPARSEADELAAQRVQFDLESQITVESIRGKAVDSEMRSALEVHEDEDAVAHRPF